LLLIICHNSLSCLLELGGRGDNGINTHQTRDI